MKILREKQIRGLMNEFCLTYRIDKKCDEKCESCKFGNRKMFGEFLKRLKR